MQTTPSVRDPCLFDRNGNPSGDHFALFTSLEISKPPKQRNTVSYRKFSEINTTDLIQDLNNSKIAQNREGSVVNIVKLYNSELSSIIDKHAPLKSSAVVSCDNDVKCVTLIVRCSLDMLYESMVTKSFIKFPSIAQIHIIKVKVKIARDK
jgi:hypothetical protein